MTLFITTVFIPTLKSTAPQGRYKIQVPYCIISILVASRDARLQIIVWDVCGFTADKIK